MASLLDLKKKLEQLFALSRKPYEAVYGGAPDVSKIKSYARKVQQRARTPLPQLRQQNLEQAQKQPWYQHPIVQQARMARLPPPPLFAETDIYKRKVQPFLERMKVPYGLPTETFLTTPRPKVRQFPIGIATSVLEEYPEMKDIREKVRLDKPLTPQEIKIAQQEKTFVVADIALTAPGKVGKLTPAQLEKRFKTKNVQQALKTDFMSWVENQFGKKFSPEIAEKSFNKAWRLAKSPEDFAKRIATQKQFTGATSFKKWVLATYDDWGHWFRDIAPPHPAEEVVKLAKEPVVKVAKEPLAGWKLPEIPKVKIGIAEDISVRLKSIREGKFSFDTPELKDIAQAKDQADFIAKYNELGAYLKSMEKAGRREVVDILTNKAPATTPLEKRMAKVYQRWVGDMAVFEKLEELGKIRKGYFPGISLEQISDPVLDDLFPKSRLSQAILDLPQLERKTKPDWLGDASLYDTFVFRSKAAVTHAYKYADVPGVVKPIDLVSKKPIIEQVQDAIPEEEVIKDFEGKIGIFQKTRLPEAAKDIAKKWTALVEGSYTGGIEDMGLKNVFRPIYKGRVDNFKWQLDMYAKIQSPKYRANAWNLLNDLAEKLGYEKNSDQWNQLVKATFDNTRRYGNSEISYKIMVDRTGDFIHVGKPVKALENWIMKNNIVDTESKAFFERTIKNILTKEQVDYSRAMEALSAARRVQYLGTIGLKLSTIIYQPLETVRAIARYPKQAPRALVDSFKKNKYAHFKDDASLRRYLGTTRISDTTWKKLLSKMEDLGYVGIQKAESWKDNVFLRAAELDGLEKGLSGEKLDNFVFDEFREFAHKYSPEDLGVVMKNPFAKIAFMFQTYGAKNINHLLRSVDRLATTPTKKKELSYLALYLVGSLGVYKLYKDVFKSERPLVDVVTGGIPGTFNPLFELGEKGLDYMRLTEKEKGGYQGERAIEQMKRKAWMNIPYMNQLMNVTGRTMGNIQRGYAETYTGNVAYPAPQTPMEKLRAVTISPYAYDYAQKYFKGDIKALGERQSELYRMAGDKIGFYEQIMGSRRTNEEINTIKTKIEEDQGGDAMEVGDRIIYWDEAEGKVKTISKISYEKSIVDAEYSLAADRFKRADDYAGWIENAEGYIKYLEKYQETLDPDYEIDDFIRIQNRIEDIQANIDKYTGYGGFTKGKAPKKITVKVAKMKAVKIGGLKKGKIPTIKLESPPKLKIYQSKPVKIETSVKGIPAIKLKPVSYSIKIVKG